jgi:hypothetical protein
MSLIGPCHVGRSHEDNGLSSISGRVDKLMDCPILENEAHEEHDDPESVVDHSRADIAVCCAWPKPLQHDHGKTVCWP